VALEAAPGSRLTIGAAARLVGRSAATLRLWERQRLVTPHRTPSGYRHYDLDQIGRLRRVARLREVDRLNAPAIRRMLADSLGAARAQGGSMIGPRLRALRKRRGLTLAQAAQKAEVSVSFMSALEKGDSGVSMSTLARVLRSYGTTIGRLTASKKHSPRQLTRATTRKTVDWRGDGVRIQQLSNGPILMESMLFEIDPGGGSRGGYSHEGEEIIFMLEGSLDVRLDGAKTSRLKKGDSLYFLSTLEHSFVNPGRSKARLIWINTPPTF
jgi:DNA-binding transcriptional MerR regulator/quercetin dioxygenase-like cupin family protein